MTTTTIIQPYVCVCVCVRVANSSVRKLALPKIARSRKMTHDAQYAILREVTFVREYKVLIFCPQIQSFNILLLSSQTGRAAAV